MSRALAGRYAVERLIERGGSASVYLARDLRHDRYVALKGLDPEVARSVGSDRFLRELRTAARLSHPHIVPVHDSGEADGLLYCVVQYVEGESLRERIRLEGHLPVAEAVRIGMELGYALADAHAHGFIQRDIKPGNVLMGPGGPCYLADFGLARAVDNAADVRLTASGLAPGTPRCIAPEQASGNPAVGPRADVYSLGCLLYELL